MTDNPTPPFPGPPAPGEITGWITPPTDGGERLDGRSTVLVTAVSGVAVDDDGFLVSLGEDAEEA